MDRPVNRANVFNTVLPAANNNLLAADLLPMMSPGVLRVYVCVSVTGIFYVTRTANGATVQENLNDGNPLTAGSSYCFDLVWKDGESINFRYSATGGTINKLQVDEYWY